MKFTAVLVSVAAAACALLSSQVAAQDKPLPWDGRGQDLTVATLESKYMLHIFKQRQNPAKADPANYVTVNPKGRSPAFNGDTGVISIAVDNDAIFGGQANFRRSELVQNVAGNTAGKTFFRASVKKDKAWANAHSWQIIFPESHLFEVRIDSTVTPPKIIFYTGGSLDVKWQTEFKLGTWYNFGIAVGGGAIELYTSTGSSQLALTKSVPNSGSAPSNYEFHYGMLTLSNDGSAPKMAAGVQDILDYNGVSVEKTVTAGGSAPATGDDAAGDDDEDTTPAATEPATKTPAATTKAPAATTKAPTATTTKPTPTTAAPAAGDADDDDEYATPAPASGDDDEYATPAPASGDDDEYATPAPASGDDDEYATPAPAATTVAPSSGASPTVSPAAGKTPKPASGKTPKPTKAPKTPKPSKTPKAPKTPKPSKTPKTPKTPVPSAKACKKKST